MSLKMEFVEKASRPGARISELCRGASRPAHSRRDLGQGLRRGRRSYQTFPEKIDSLQEGEEALRGRVHCCAEVLNSF